MSDPFNASTHELRFVSLYQPGQAVSVPYDGAGKVRLDELPERLKNADLGARALVCKEYAFPAVEPKH